LQILAVLPGRWAVLAARRSGETKRDIEPLGVLGERLRVTRRLRWRHMPELRSIGRRSAVPRSRDRRFCTRSRGAGASDRYAPIR